MVPEGSWFVDDRSVVSVSELNRKVRQVLEQEEGLQDVWLRGELSNYSGPHQASGHMYFRVKDEEAELDCVMWRRNVRQVTADLREGLEVLAHGSVGLYEQRGSYQFYVDRILEAGDGELHLRYEELKRTLREEGLFDEDRKRPVPSFPRTVGVVTSREAAAFQDVLNVLSRRSPHVRVLLADARVQGDGAGGTVREGIERLNRHAASEEVDVIIVTRGGGSLEDLWAFNEETAVRAIAESSVPVIVGVGHETDVTLAGLAADVRAPTPSAAAEVAAVDRGDALERLDGARGRLARRLEGMVRLGRGRLDGLASRPVLARSGVLLGEVWQRFDEASFRLPRAMQARVDAGRSRVRALAERSVLRDGRALLRDPEGRVQRVMDRLPGAVVRRVERAEHTVEGLSSRLDALSPLSVLERGYAVAHVEGKTVRGVEDVDVGDALRVRVLDGEISSLVEDVLEDDA